MRQNLVCVFLILFLIVAMPLDAGFRPGFNVDQCSWSATHIILLQTTGKDGFFSVVESLKGDLKPGDSLELPDLTPKEGAVSISSNPKPRGYRLEDEWGISEQIPRQPVGSRLILFLKKQDGGSPGAQAKWVAASVSMKVSALWIDDRKAYCFQQWMNPGPSALSRCVLWPARSSDVAVFTARIQEVLQVQKDLAFALAMKNVNARAERLGRIALGNIFVAQKEAIDALGKSGIVALPEILQVLDKPPGFYEGDFLIRALKTQQERTPPRNCTPGCSRT